MPSRLRRPNYSEQSTSKGVQGLPPQNTSLTSALVAPHSSELSRLKLRSKGVDERRARPGRTRQDHKKRVLAVSDLREPSWPSGRQDLNLRPLDPQGRSDHELTCKNAEPAGRDDAVERT